MVEVSHIISKKKSKDPIFLSPLMSCLPSEKRNLVEISKLIDSLVFKVSLNIDFIIAKTFKPSILKRSSFTYNFLHLIFDLLKEVKGKKFQENNLLNYLIFTKTLRLMITAKSCQIIFLIFQNGN